MYNNSVVDSLETLAHNASELADRMKRPGDAKLLESDNLLIRLSMIPMIQESFMMKLTSYIASGDESILRVIEQ